MAVSEDEQDLVLRIHVGKATLPEGIDKERFEGGQKSDNLVAAEKEVKEHPKCFTKLLANLCVRMHSFVQLVILAI